jgi:hypothetical protein
MTLVHRTTALSALPSVRALTDSVPLLTGVVWEQLRERDKRERLVAAKIVKENPVKMKELLDQENSNFIIRPYVTILAYLIFWAGMLLQFTPMCSFITFILPFWFGVESEHPSPNALPTAYSCHEWRQTGGDLWGGEQTRATWWCWPPPFSSP